MHDDSWRPTFLALFDQAIVSGTRFLTSILVGRAAGVDALGVYSNALSAVILFGVVQEALITTPYTIYSNRLQGADRRLYAGGALLQHLALSLGSIPILGLIGAILYLGFGEREVSAVIWLLTCVIPFYLAQEFVRRLSFAHMRMGTALVLDVITSSMQIGLLLFLLMQQELTAFTSFLAIGSSCLLTSAVWLIANRRAFAIRRRSLKRVWKNSWSFGRWGLAGQVAGTLTGYMPVWVLTATIGLTAAGFFTAGQYIVLLANPIILGFANVIVPRTAIAYARGGREELARVTGYATGAIGGFLLICAVVVGLFGDFLLGLFYGSDYGGQSDVIATMAACMPFWAISSVLGAGLCAIERPDIAFTANFVGLVIITVACALLATPMGALGASIALLAASASNAAFQAVAFVRLLRSADQPEPAGVAG